MVPSCYLCSKRRAVIHGLCSTCGFGFLYGTGPVTAGMFIQAPKGKSAASKERSIEDDIKTVQSLLEPYPAGLKFKEILDRLIPPSRCQQSVRTALWVGIDSGVFKIDSKNIVKLTNQAPATRVQRLLNFWRGRKWA